MECFYANQCCTFVLLFSCVWSVCCGTVNNSEVYLHRYLFEEYNPDVIPVTDGNLPIKVGIRLYLLSIDNIDEKRQTFSARAFLELTWQDSFLKWDPNDYNGKKLINVQNKNIWLPDISLYGTFGKPTDLGQDGEKSNVDNNGSVITWPAKMFTVACKISVAKFPFDEQTCEFDFLSWTNPTPILQLRSLSGKVDLAQYVESVEWNLIHTTAYRRLNPYGTSSWDHVHFILKLRRKWLFQAMNVILPIVCISLLNILCFLLPAISGERITLCISIFLTLAVFLTIVTSTMPESSDEVAVFGIYVGLQLLGSAITICMTVLSLYFFYKEHKSAVPVPFKLFARMFCTIPCCKRNVYIDDTHNTMEHCNDLDIAIIQNGDVKPKVPDPAPVSTEDSEVTWVIVSHAMDRMCIIASLLWHTLLLGSFMYSVNT